MDELVIGKLSAYPFSIYISRVQQHSLAVKEVILELPNVKISILKVSLSKVL